MKFYGTYKEVTKKFDGEERILNNKVYEYCTETAALLAMVEDFKNIINSNVEYKINDIYENSIIVKCEGKRYCITAEFIS